MGDTICCVRVSRKTLLPRSKSVTLKSLGSVFKNLASSFFWKRDGRLYITLFGFDHIEGGESLTIKNILPQKEKLVWGEVHRSVLM